MHIDLNLLGALEALLQEISVGKAAARLHLSQPAMSRTLGRIRVATGDPILVRSGRGMVLSPRALAMSAEVSAMLRQARVLLSPEQELEPARLERTFTIRCHDALITGIGPEVVRRLQLQAPNVTVRFLAEAEDDESSAGRVDLEIGSAKARSPMIRDEQIAQDHLVVVLRSDHAATRGRLTIQRYAAAQHVLVSRRGRLRDPIDDALEAAGLRRRVSAVAPTSFAALHLVKECNLFVAVAARACGPILRAMRLVARPLPVACAPVPIVQSWHEYLENDRAHVWLRSVTRSVIADLMAK